MPVSAWVPRASELLRRALSPVPIERNELDWKSGLSTRKDRLTEHLSAFANNPGGGFIVYGIEDSNGLVTGVTTENAAAIVAQLTNLGRAALEPPIAIEHAIVEWGESPLLFVYVPESAVKPVHLRGKTIEFAWIRSGASSRRASRQEIGSLMLHSQTPRWEQMRASSCIPVEDLPELLDLSVISRLLNRPLPGDGNELLQWMVDEGLIQLEGDGAYITSFGAVAAARDLGSFGSLGRKGIRVVRYKGLNKVQTLDEQLGRKGYAVGFEGLIRQLRLILPHNEVIRKALRTETSLYPELALRELIANALIHQDFTISGASPMIEIFDNRIEFTSPGGLLPGKVPDRLIGTTPVSRNEILASSFRRYRLCEERGTGFQKVVALVELYGLPPLAFVPAEDAFKVVLFAPRQFAEMSQSERIEAAYQHAVLKYFSSSSMTNTSLRERLKVGERQRNQVTNLIADAMAVGRIKRKDPNSANKFAEYLPYWV